MRTTFALIAILAGCTSSATPTLTTTAPLDAGSTAEVAEPAPDDVAPAEDAQLRQLAEDATAQDTAQAPACDCDDGNPCTVDLCLADGTCDTDLPAAGTGCPGGVCVAGECKQNPPADSADTLAPFDVSNDAPDAADTAPGDADAGSWPDDAADAKDDAADAQPDTPAPPPDDADALDLGPADVAPDLGPDVGDDADTGAPDAAVDVPELCGCPGDLVALTGDCTAPAGVKVVGTVAAVPGVVGGAYHFATGQTTPPRTAGLRLEAVDLSGDFTFEAWVRLLGYDMKRPAIATSENGMSSVQGFNLYADMDQAAMQHGTHLSLCTAPFSCAKINGPALPIWQWAHVAVVRKGVVVRLFVQGKAIGDVNFGGTLADTMQGLWIGSASETTAYAHDMYGDLDEVRISKGAAYWDDFTPVTTCAP